MGLFSKNSITLEETIRSLCYLIANNVNKEPLKDIDGNIILTKKEASLILMTHFLELLEKYNIKSINQLELIDIFTNNDGKLKGEDDRIVELSRTTDAIKKIRSFFKNIPMENTDFLKNSFLFDKDLNPIQKALIMGWCVTNFQTIDTTFESTMEDFEIVADVETDNITEETKD